MKNCLSAVAWAAIHRQSGGGAGLGDAPCSASRPGLMTVATPAPQPLQRTRGP